MKNRITKFWTSTTYRLFKDVIKLFQNNLGSIPGKRLYLLERDQTSSRVHSASYSMVNEGSFTGKKGYRSVKLTTLPPSVERENTWRCRLRLKCEGTCAETRFRLSAKGTSPFKSVGASVPSTTGSRGVRISGSNAGYTMFRGSVKSTGYPFHPPVSPSIPLPCVTVCHHISTRPYFPSTYA